MDQVAIITEAQKRRNATFALIALVMVYIVINSFMFLPTWVFYVFLGLVVLNGVWINVQQFRLDRLNKTTPARCSNCDYDLCGTIAGGGTNCPECGKTITRSEKGIQS